MKMKVMIISRAPAEIEKSEEDYDCPIYGVAFGPEVFSADELVAASVREASGTEKDEIAGRLFDRKERA